MSNNILKQLAVVMVTVHNVTVGREVEDKTSS